MSTKELKKLIKKNVLKVISEILSDPDFNLPLKKSFVKSVKKASREKSRGKLYTLNDLNN
jgi:hypothetical protein